MTAPMPPSTGPAPRPTPDRTPRFPGWFLPTTALVGIVGLLILAIVALVRMTDGGEAPTANPGGTAPTVGPSPSTTAGPKPTVPTTVPTATTVPGGPTATTVANRPPTGGFGNTPCSQAPGDLEAVPRSTVTAAPLGSWFHPIFKSSTFQSSGGFEGQWSWAHTLCLETATGGQFRHEEGVDGQFVFRHTATPGSIGFAVLTTSKHKSQFMEGGDFPFSINIRAVPGTIINVQGPNGATCSQAVSDGGDLTTILPDDGVTRFSFTERPAVATFEARMWVGPYDRSKGINTCDAR